MPPTALLAREEGGQLAYAGGAMVTLANPDRERFWRNVERLASDAPVGDAKPPRRNGCDQRCACSRATSVRGLNFSSSRRLGRRCLRTGPIAYLGAPESGSSPLGCAPMSEKCF